MRMSYIALRFNRQYIIFYEIGTTRYGDCHSGKAPSRNDRKKRDYLHKVRAVHVSRRENTASQWQRLLTLRVGRSLAGTLEAGLLAFLDARIAGQETAFTHGSHILGIHLDERAGQAQYHRVCLTGDTAAGDMDSDIQGFLILAGSY